MEAFGIIQINPGCVCWFGGVPLSLLAVKKKILTLVIEKFRIILKKAIILRSMYELLLVMIIVLDMI